MAERFKNQSKIVKDGKKLQGAINNLAINPQPRNYNQEFRVEPVFENSRDSTYSLDGLIAEKHRLQTEITRLDKSIAHRKIELGLV